MPVNCFARFSRSLPQQERLFIAGHECRGFDALLDGEARVPVLFPLGFQERHQAFSASRKGRLKKENLVKNTF